MGTNLTQALGELDLLKERIHNSVNQVEIELVTKIFDRVIGSPPLGTPRDTQWASAGWRISLNRPTPGVVGEKGDVTTARSSQSKSLSSFLTADLSKIDSIFIDNRVPYIEELNDGSASKQSIPDFVDVAVYTSYRSLQSKRIS